MSQDPLENFFGCQRQRGGANENPNVAQFCKNTQALRVINSVCGTVSKSNSRGNKKAIDLQAESKPMPKRRKTKKKKVPMKTYPATPVSVSLSASMISESKDYPAKLPDLPATATDDEYPTAILHISESVGPPSSFSDSDTNMSEDIESPDMSPFTSDDEVPLTNQHIQTANYSSHCREALVPMSTKESFIHSVTESASDHELPGVLDTIIMESSDSDMELSEDSDSSNNLPEIPTVSEDEDELTDCFLLGSPMSGITSDNPAPHSPKKTRKQLAACSSVDLTDSRPTSPIVRPKSSAEEDRITSALATGPAGEKIVRLFNITLTRQDFWTLKSMEWLNDQVMLCMLFKCNCVHNIVML